VTLTFDLVNTKSIEAMSSPTPNQHLKYESFVMRVSAYHANTNA